MKKLFFAVILITHAAGAYAGPIFSSSSYSADITFTDALGHTSMTLAYDGTDYWSASGGSSSGNRYAQYDSSGNLVSVYGSGLDFRSVFTDSSGNVYARAFANSTIYQQTSPGIFSSYLSLTGGSLNSQSSVVMNDNGEYLAMNNGLVNVWDASGLFSSSFSLAGYSGSYPENRGIAVVGDYIFTYFNQTLSAWDYTGALLDQTILNGAGTSFDSYFSLSYANDRIFIVDSAGGTWRGFDIGFSNSGAVPAPGTVALLMLGLAGLRVVKRKSQA